MLRSWIKALQNEARNEGPEMHQSEYDKVQKVVKLKLGTKMPQNEAQDETSEIHHGKDDKVQKMLKTKVVDAKRSLK